MLCPTKGYLEESDREEKEALKGIETDTADKQSLAKGAASEPTAS